MFLVSRKYKIQNIAPFARLTYYIFGLKNLRFEVNNVVQSM